MTDYKTLADRISADAAKSIASGVAVRGLFHLDVGAASHYANLFAIAAALRAMENDK